MWYLSLLDSFGGIVKQTFWTDFLDNELSSDNEFVSVPDSKEDQNSRRDFLKLMGAGIALTSMSCIRRPAEKIVPYANRPEEIEPGISNYYTSTYVQGFETQPVLIKTREGRPIYVKPNPEFKGISSRAIAHVLDLYDPDRLKHPVKKEDFNFKKSSWEEFDNQIAEALKLGNTTLVTGNVYSPTLKLLIDNFRKKGVDHYSWEPTSFDGVKKANQLCFKKSVVPGYHFDKSKVVVSIGADFLSTYLSPTEFSSDFAKTRNPENMSKLVVFESIHSLTGANSDLRFVVKPSLYPKVVLGLCYEMIKRGASISSIVRTRFDEYSNMPKKLNIDPDKYYQLCDLLWNNRRKSLVISNGSTGSDDTELQIATNLLNYMLDSYSSTIDMARTFNFSSSYESLDELFKKLDDGKVSTLIVAGINPAYLSKSFSKHVSKARRVFYLGDRLDETAQHATHVAPLSHQMESWGDAEIKRSIHAIVQPTIRPLYDTRSLGECLLKWSNNETKYYDFLKDNWKSRSLSLQFEKFWIDLLHKGFIVENISSEQVNFNYSSLAYAFGKNSNSEIELFLYQKSTMLEGNQANNAWLQELPCPVTKVVWDNYLLISKPLASKLGFSKNGEHALVTKGNTKLSVPVLISPGISDSVVGLAVGYGRTNAGRVGTKIGINAYVLTDNDLQVSVKKTSGFTTLANAQGHHRLDGRQLVVDATLDEYKKSPSTNIKTHKIFSLYPKHEYKGHRWAMAIDLNLCTGCSACVTACQSENNIPSVGKKYVLRGREMHWIRLDRYYKGDEDNPDVLFQPMLCQHCENASCEAVCPVIATVHGEEGLNQMIYNRCVGTRYCSNNCPYKVRRFNWFNYSKVEKPLNKAFNPDVTVRSRGVMEKCTFCTQRIKETKILAKRENREVGGDDVVTACQEACPTNAIIFGDINNEKSSVKKAFKSERSFSVLEEYNNIPMVKYKTKIRNKDKA